MGLERHRTLSNVAEISETLLYNFFFRLIELTGVVVDDFLQEKTEQRFNRIKSSRHPLLCLRTQILRQIERSILNSQEFAPNFCIPSRNCDHALRAIIRSSGFSEYATANPQNTAYDRTSASSVTSH